MAASIYKWLVISLLSIPLASGRGLGYHPIHVSVVEINHNAADKTLEISCKIFTDDFERVLAQNYKTKVDLIRPDVKVMDKLISDYIKTHLSVKTDGKAANFSYLGFERDGEVVYSYVQVDNIGSVNKIELVNKLMHDLFTDQENLMHIMVSGKRKSTKLDYPDKEAVFSF